jgi:hypothetical protein
VYRLPWLTPAGSGAQPVAIEAEAATGVSPPAPKELKALIALRED